MSGVYRNRLFFYEQPRGNYTAGVFPKVLLRKLLLIKI